MPDESPTFSFYISTVGDSPSPFLLYDFNPSSSWNRSENGFNHNNKGRSDGTKDRWVEIDRRHMHLTLSTPAVGTSER